MRLLRDAQRWNKPVRILYASYFDPAGKSMPVTPARQIEFALRWKLGRRKGVLLKGRADNFMERHGTDSGAELDALEAEHPGELRRLFEERILEFKDDGLRERIREAREEAQEIADAELEKCLAPYADRLADIKARAEEMVANYRPRLEALSEEFAEELEPLKDELESVWHVIHSSTFKNTEHRCFTPKLDLVHKILTVYFLYPQPLVSCQKSCGKLILVSSRTQ
jgi:hypothetical protein